MASLEKLVSELPRGHSIRIGTVGRHLGAYRRYELRYYEDTIHNTPTYIYTGRTIGEVADKLRFKLKHQDQRIDCLCDKHAVYGGSA